MIVVGNREGIRTKPVYFTIHPVATPPARAYAEQQLYVATQCSRTPRKGTVRVESRAKREGWKSARRERVAVFEMIRPICASFPHPTLTCAIPNVRVSSSSSSSSSSYFHPLCPTSSWQPPENHPSAKREERTPTADSLQALGLRAWNPRVTPQSTTGTLEREGGNYIGVYVYVCTIAWRERSTAPVECHISRREARPCDERRQREGEKMIERGGGWESKMIGGGDWRVRNVRVYVLSVVGNSCKSRRAVEIQWVGKKEPPSPTTLWPNFFSFFFFCYSLVNDQRVSGWKTKETGV